MSEPLAYEAKEAAAACGLSLDTIRRALRNGDLKAADPRVDGRAVAKTIITRRELQRWLDNSQREAS